MWLVNYNYSTSSVELEAHVRDFYTQLSGIIHHDYIRQKKHLAEQLLLTTMSQQARMWKCQIP